MGIKEETVLEYAKRKRFLDSPLRFNKYVDSILMEDGTLKSLSITEAIKKLLVTIRSEMTYHVSNGRYQCAAGARRSVGDMHRLLKRYWNPDVTLFETMRAYYELNQEAIGRLKTMPNNQAGVYFNYCGDVRKVVLMLSIYAGYVSNYQMTEYGIHFKDWEKIGLE